DDPARRAERGNCPVGRRPGRRPQPGPQGRRRRVDEPVGGQPGPARVLGDVMAQFIDLTLGGLSAGAVYSAVALALVLIWRATRIVNFAQGGMLMITTFLAYTVISDGGSYWLALVVAVASGLVLGAVVERLVIRPVENKPPLNAVVVTFG